MTRTRSVLALAALVVGAGLSCMVLVGSPEPDTEGPSRADLGADLFRGYCSSCHGDSARGDGPAAAALRTRPADLTRIAAVRGGEFPAPEIARFIDGRERVLAHGTSDMPVWGRRFDDRSVRDETLLQPGQIWLIVEYLRSIQEL